MNQLVSQLMNIASVVRDPSCARSDNDFCSVLRAVVLPLNGMPTSITLCLVVRVPVLNLGMLNGQGRSSIELYIISWYIYISTNQDGWTYSYIFSSWLLSKVTMYLDIFTTCILFSSSTVTMTSWDQPCDYRRTNKKTSLTFLNILKITKKGKNPPPVHFCL